MLKSRWRMVGACAALGLLLCTPAVAHALHGVSTAKTDDSNQDSWRPLQQMQTRVALLEEERGAVVEENGNDDAEDEIMGGDSLRKLLHGCHGRRCAHCSIFLHAYSICVKCSWSVVGTLHCIPGAHRVAG